MVQIIKTLISLMYLTCLFSIINNANDKDSSIKSLNLIRQLNLLSSFLHSLQAVIDQLPLEYRHSLHWEDCKLLSQYGVL